MSHHRPVRTGVANEAEKAVFDRLSARVFTLPSPTRFRSSNPLFPTLRDGTDPLLGGHPAAPAASWEARL